MPTVWYKFSYKGLEVEIFQINKELPWRQYNNEEVVFINRYIRVDHLEQLVASLTLGSNLSVFLLKIMI